MYRKGLSRNFLAVWPMLLFSAERSNPWFLTLSSAAELVPRVEAPRREGHQLMLPIALSTAEQVSLLVRRHVVYNL